MTGAGVLSIHLEGGACRVGCEFCYLGARADAGPTRADLGLLEAAVGRLTFEELAVALSEPVTAAAPALERLKQAARGRPLQVTTTLPIAQAHPELFDGVARVSLSVDPRKGAVSPERIDAVARRLDAEVVLIVSLVTPAFAAELFEGGLLERLVDLPSVGKVALNALKPPPPWCDRAFFLRAFARIAPLLERALERRLFLDCWMAARLFGLGGCPGRADLSPAPGGLAFRACVYQPAPDVVVRDLGALATHAAGFVPPARCPWE